MKYKPASSRKSVLALQVALNGKPLCLAGVGNGVLSSEVVWVGGKGLSQKALKQLRLNVGGLDTVTKEHLCWEARKILVGDEITIKVVKSSKVDPPISRTVPLRAKP